MKINLNIECISKALANSLKSSLAPAILLLSVSDAMAVHLEYGAGAEVQYSDNIAQDSADEKDEWIYGGVVGIAANEDSGPILVNSNALLRYEDYAHNTFSDQFLFSLNNQAEWRIIPDRFSWVLNDRFTQLSIDTFNTDTPANSQNVNALSTGPNLVYRLSLINRIELDGRYENYYYEESDADNNRYSAYARWVHTLSPSTELSLNISGEKTTFDENDLIDNYTRQDYSITYLTQSTNTEYEIELGRTVIQSSAADHSGYFATADGVWSFTPNLSFGLSAGSRLTDASQELIDSVSDTVQGAVQTAQVSGDVFREKEFGFTLNKKGSGLRVKLQGDWVDQDYKTTSLDQRIKRVVGKLDYDLTATLVGSVFGEFERMKAIETKREDDDSTLGVSISYLIRRDWAIELTTRYTKRESNQAGADFNELAGYLTLTYKEKLLSEKGS